MGARIHVGPFEAWEDEPEAFDVVYADWHWNGPDCWLLRL
jgi:hypothetical protein